MLQRQEDERFRSARGCCRTLLLDYCKIHGDCPAMAKPKPGPRFVRFFGPVLRARRLARTSRHHHFNNARALGYIIW